ncbi:hypothetical protein IKB17_04065 [bacterium]|nr:hypothetical protein [bacterium]
MNINSQINYKTYCSKNLEKQDNISFQAKPKLIKNFKNSSNSSKPIMNIGKGLLIASLLIIGGTVYGLYKLLLAPIATINKDKKISSSETKTTQPTSFNFINKNSYTKLKNDLYQLEYSKEQENVIKNFKNKNKLKQFLLTNDKEKGLCPGAFLNPFGLNAVIDIYSEDNDFIEKLLKTSKTTDNNETTITKILLTKNMECPELLQKLENYPNALEECLQIIYPDGKNILHRLFKKSDNKVLPSIKFINQYYGKKDPEKLIKMYLTKEDYYWVSKGGQGPDGYEEKVTSNRMPLYYNDSNTDEVLKELNIILKDFPEEFELIKQSSKE